MSKENVADIEPEPSKLSDSSSSSIEIEDCPPTPEHMPPGSKTPPPASSSSRRKDYKKSSKRRSKSLDGGRPSSPDSDQLCPICLGELDNKSITDTCRHTFCFTCLLEWSKVKAVCPLCKGKFSSIIHNVRSETEFEKYDIPPPQPNNLGNSRLLESELLWTRRFRYHTTRGENRRRFLADRAGPQDIIRLRDHWRRRRGPGTSDFRREVYDSDLWAQSAAGGRSRECSPEWYRNNEAQTHRLVPWLNRELNAILGITGQHSRQAHLLSQIMDWITLYSIGSPDLSERLLPHLGTNTEHFQHELLQFARSPYDLTGYDRNVRYERRRIRMEVVSSDSEEEDSRLGVMAEIRSRMEQLDRFMADRAPPFNLGVTNFPERSSRQETGGQREEIRRGTSERPRSGERERRRGDRDYRREVERLRELRHRGERGEQEQESRRERRKKKKPSKYQRQVPLSFREAQEGEEGEEVGEALDLSSQPSTSSGHSSGLHRLVIPDSDSESGEERLVVDDEEEEEEERNVTVRAIISDILSAVIKTKTPRAADIEEIEPRQETFTAQQLGNFVQSQISQIDHQYPHPSFMIPQGYYTSPYNPGYLSELTGMMAGDLTVGPGPGAEAQQEEENSDLEVVDVISAKPARKPKDPEVVELSDSESEAESEEQQEREETSGTAAQAQPEADSDVVYIISSDEETETVQPPVEQGYTSGLLAPSSYMRMSLISSYDPGRSQGSLKKSSKKAAPPPAESSEEDDLIVVKTEHNTIDPITKRQIVEPVKNKKCNHIYEKSTIYSMIDLARENSKPVKCPYMGCNCRDFKKTDLVKDKEVLGHIHVMKEEQIKADKERKEKERKAVEKRKKNKGGGYASDVSITIDGDEDSPDLTEFELPGIEAPNLSESSSDETNVAKTSKNKTQSFSQSSDSFVESSSSKKMPEADTEKPKRSIPSEVSPERAKKKKKKKTQERLSVSSHSESSDTSDSDLPLARLGRARKQPRRLNDSYAGSDLDGSDSDMRKKGSKKKGKSPKKVRLVSKKVTETWCYEKAGAALKKGKKRRKKRADYEEENSQEEESEEEVEAAANKGKSSKGKPPKNSSFSRNRPKRAKKVSYQEFDEEF